VVQRLGPRQAVQRGKALLEALRLAVEGPAAGAQPPAARQPGRQAHVRLAQRALHGRLARLVARAARLRSSR
jgi:plasmid stabilization system protein ParE